VTTSEVHFQAWDDRLGGPIGVTPNPDPSLPYTFLWDAPLLRTPPANADNLFPRYAVDNQGTL
jgi:hypothetical protein